MPGTDLSGAAHACDCQPYGRRTGRLQDLARHLGVALGGRPAQALASRLLLPVTKDTFLRSVRTAMRPPASAPRVIGISSAPPPSAPMRWTPEPRSPAHNGSHPRLALADDVFLPRGGNICQPAGRDDLYTLLLGKCFLSCQSEAFIPSGGKYFLALSDITVPTLISGLHNVGSEQYGNTDRNKFFAVLRSTSRSVVGMFHWIYWPWRTKRLSGEPH